MVEPAGFVVEALHTGIAEMFERPVVGDSFQPVFGVGTDTLFHVCGDPERSYLCRIVNPDSLVNHDSFPLSLRCPCQKPP